MTTILPPHRRAWQDETERPDAEPDPCDADEVRCAACGLPTLLDDLYMDDTARLLCRSCWFRSFTLQPLPEVA